MSQSWMGKKINQTGYQSPFVSHIADIQKRHAIFAIKFIKMSLRRALHFVFKIANRNETMKFYREILGMKVSITFFERSFAI